MSTPDDLSLNNCGCCEPEPLPSPIYNRPGLPALSYRAGTYGTFLRRMFNRLSAYALPDGDHEGERPLADLSTRELDDPSIALLDASAVVADVLTFYQERIANEGFLRTSIERQSILELARSIGYELSPGVAAGTYLAFTIEEAAGAPLSAEIPAGSKVQSIPPQGKMPQTFETTEDITARKDWNTIRPQLTQHQYIDTITKRIYLAGTSTNLKVGDRLLIVQDSNTSQILTKVFKVVVDQDNKRTEVHLSDSPSLTILAKSAPPMGEVDIEQVIPFSAASVTQYIINKSWSNDDLNTFLTVNNWNSEKLLTYVAQYRALYPDTSGEVYAMRASAPFFGYNAPRYEALPKTSGSETLDYGVGHWTDAWEIWKNQVTGDYYGSTADVNLDHTLQGILPKSWVVIENSSGNQLACKATTVVECSLYGFAMSSKMTGINLEKPNGTPLGNITTDKPSNYQIRNSVAHLQSEKLTLSELPMTDHISATQYIFLLNGLVLGLKIGQAVMLTGERWDADGIISSEVLIIQDIMHYGGSTMLTFEQGTEHFYKRDTVTLNANVAHATHGETSSEILGNGSGAHPNQRFTLRKPLLTYTSAPTPTGTQSTLEVRVNDVLWSEASSLYPLGPKDQKYVVRIDDNAKATIIFGDGKHGTRLPTGSNNVKATYRSGIGLDGDVTAGALSMLSTKPLGVKGVTNPLAASGGDNPEKMDNARSNAPLTVRTLNRIVTLTDYEDFARAFAGIGKAQAVDLWSGETHLIHLTVAGADGNPVDDDSDLFTYLIDGVNNSRDPEQIVRVDSFTRLLFNVEANVAIDKRYIKQNVSAEIKSALQEAFSFEKRAFGQFVTAAEVITLIQNIKGVIAVDLNGLYLSSASSTLNTLLPVQIARIANGNFLLAQLLLINPIGITLGEMKP